MVLPQWVTCDWCEARTASSTATASAGAERRHDTGPSGSCLPVGKRGRWQHMQAGRAMTGIGGGQPPFDHKRRIESKEDVGSPKGIIGCLLITFGLAVVSFLLWLAQGS
jgi:hypothetical protein